MFTACHLRHSIAGRWHKQHAVNRMSCRRIGTEGAEALGAGQGDCREVGRRASHRWRPLGGSKDSPPSCRGAWQGAAEPVGGVQEPRGTARESARREHRATGSCEEPPPSHRELAAGCQEAEQRGRRGVGSRRGASRGVGLPGSRQGGPSYLSGQRERRAAGSRKDRQAAGESARRVPRRWGLAEGLPS